MIDIRKLTYKLIAILEDGSKLDISRATEDLGWEEGENELAMRLSFTVYNTLYQGKSLSELLKPGCLVTVIADWGDGTEEVARGIIMDWDTDVSNSTDTLSILAYDELFYLQKSQDNRYITAGTGTKTAITGILKDWGIPLGKYDGPDISHAKTLFKNDYLADIITDLLETAAKQGKDTYVVRASKGKVSVLKTGSNQDVYHFDEDSNLTVTKDAIHTQNLVTRVKIIGKEDSKGRQPVQAVLDGQIQYGIRQRIYNRKENDKLSAAKAEAQKIIDEDGKPEHKISFQAPDVPMLRKGDQIHAKTRTQEGYFIVQSIQHNAAEASMTMSVKLLE